jgi:hypothetical protein
LEFGCEYAYAFESLEYDCWLSYLEPPLERLVDGRWGVLFAVPFFCICTPTTSPTTPIIIAIICLVLGGMIGKSA